MMIGINLGQPVSYRFSSLRFFKEGEYHLTRWCPDDVLLLVFDGVLRFRENGIDYEVCPGQYHIQRGNTFHEGIVSSDAPQYFYVHFHGQWGEGEETLPFEGSFDYDDVRSLIEELDRLAHSNAPYILQTAKFYELLSRLFYRKPVHKSLADRIADYISAEFCGELTLEMICKKFHFSKNHIINTFRNVYGMTPVTYINQLRLQKAKYLIEVTSESLESISVQCGYHNYSHFYKLFYRENRCSPAQWRERKRSDAIV